MPTTVAAFDWDGTLTTRDCVIPFLTRVAGTVAFTRGLVSRPTALASGVMRRDRDRLKALGVAAALTGRQVHEVDDAARRFADHVRDRWMRPDTVARLRWHQAMGHRVVLVSASLAPYLQPLGSHLGVDAVLCTELERHDGRYTGLLDGPNCRGAHKVRRLEQWMHAQHGDLDLHWAYGDSSGDTALLTAATRGVRVSRARLDAVPSTPMETR